MGMGSKWAKELESQETPPSSFQRAYPLPIISGYWDPNMFVFSGPLSRQEDHSPKYTKSLLSHFKHFVEPKEGVKLFRRNPGCQ